MDFHLERKKRRGLIFLAQRGRGRDIIWPPVFCFGEPGLARERKGSEKKKESKIKQRERRRESKKDMTDPP